MKGSTIHIKTFSFLAFCLALAVSATALLVSPSAVISTAHAQSDADIEQAKQRFREGKAFYEDEDYLEAARAFEDAYKLSSRSELLYNVGRAYWRANRLKKAEQFFQQYLNELPDAPNADEVVESIIEIQEEMAAQLAQVDITSSVDGVEIFVGDESQPRCTTPCTISILPGSRRFTARPEGMAPIERRIALGAEQQASLAFDLPGSLAITTDQRTAKMTVSGQGSWQLPLDEPINLPAGTHKVVVEGGDDARWTGDVEVTAGETMRMLVPLVALNQGGEQSTLRSVSYGLVGASAGFLVGGILMGLQASDTHAELQSQQQALGRVDAKMVEQGRNEQFGANILYALSAASFASGAGLFAWDLYGGNSSSEEEISPSPDTGEEQSGSEQDELLGLDAPDDGSRRDAPSEDSAEESASDDAPAEGEEDEEPALF